MSGKIIAITNQKGGVGKTTTCTNLGIGLANEGKKVLLPLVPAIKEKLLAVKEQQEFNRNLCGNSYSKEYLDYVCVNELGERLRPGYITSAFPKLLKDFGLRRIRFHDLRHSRASLLLANNVPMKQIHNWLGHCEFSATANIYAHLDYSSKISSAQAMVEGFNFGSMKESTNTAEEISTEIVSLQKKKRLS